MRYRIGSFKKLLGLSDATLRFYESLGLLSPRRDASNDYRYYDEEDLLQAVQVLQYSAFDIALGELPGSRKPLLASGMRDLLDQRIKKTEEEINELYERLGRMKRFQSALGRVTSEEQSIAKMNIGGIYRLFLSDPEVAADPEAQNIAARWLSYAPSVHSTMRIPLAELASDREGPYDVHVGIGLLENCFVEKGERLRPPIRYTPPNTCVHGVLTVESLRSICRKDLEPFFRFMETNGLLPMDDMFGWVVLVGREGEGRRFHLSLRIGVA